MNDDVLPSTGSRALSDDHLRGAEMARKEAALAADDAMREAFLKLAKEWERMAGMVPARPVTGSSD